MFNNNERKRVELISSDLTFWPSQRHHPCSKRIQSFVIFLSNVCTIKHVHKKPDLVCSNRNKALIQDLLSNFQVDNAWMVTITHVFTTIKHILEKIRPWIPAFLTHILRFCQEEGVYIRYFWASASLEICALGGSYFGYSVFLGVTLTWSMQSLESLFFDLQHLY